MLVAQTTRPLQKETDSWRALRQRFGLTRSMGVGQREKEGKEARKREQPGQTGARERRKAAEKRHDRNSRFEREEGKRRRRRRRREEKDKKVTRAGIEPAAPAPSQPTRQTTRPLQKETASWQALRQRFGMTRSLGVGQRKKEGKEARKREQPGRTGAGERRKEAEKRQDRNSISPLYTFKFTWSWLDRSISPCARFTIKNRRETKPSFSKSLKKKSVKVCR